MDFKFSDEQRMLEETVGRLVRDSYTFDARNKALESEHGFSTDTWTQFAELGLLGVPRWHSCALRTDKLVLV